MPGFTYDDALPTALDRVRFILDDVDEADVLLADTTYVALIDVWGEVEAAARAATAIASHMARDINSFGEAAGIRVSYGNRALYYTNLAAQIRSEGASLWEVKIGAIKRGTVCDAQTDQWSHYLRLCGLPAGQTMQDWLGRRYYAAQCAS